jgi:uncharacterized protein (DUF58 family)
VTSRRLSPRLGAYAAFGAFFLLLGAASARLEPLAMAAPFAVALVLGLASREEPSFELRRDVAGTNVFEGDETRVSVSVRALTDLPLVELAGPLPPGAELVAGSNRDLLSLARGEDRLVSYAFRMPHRAVFDLGPVRARAHAASAASSWDVEAGGWVACVVYPAPAPLRSRLVPSRTRSSVGSYRSRVAGEGFDFLDLRPFAPGDQTRRINWRATARRDSLVVNQFAAERNADVVLVMDVLSESGTPGRSVLDMSARAAAALARHFLREKNRVGYLELGHYVHWVLPGSGRRQWHRILELLARLDVRERYVTFELESVPPRILPPGAFVVGVSSLANPVWSRAMVELSRRGHEVAIVVPWEPDLTPPDRGDSREQALAARIWTLERETTVEELRRTGIPCEPWKAGEPLDSVVQAVSRAQRRSGR